MVVAARPLVVPSLVAALILAMAAPTAAGQAPATPADPYLGPDPVATSIGAYHQCILFEDKTARCDSTAKSCFGTICSDTPEDAAGVDHVRTIPDVVAVRAGHLHACFLLDSGNVDCIVDDGPGIGYAGGDAVALAVGSGSTVDRAHACVVRAGGDVVCFRVSADPSYAPALLGTYPGTDAIDVAAYGQAMCILRSTGNVDCHGLNDPWIDILRGYSGGDAVAVHFYNGVGCVVTSGGNIDCWGSRWGGHSYSRTDGQAVALALGYYHGCVLTVAGNVECTGTTQGAVVGDRSGDALAVFAGGFSTCILQAWMDQADRKWLRCGGSGDAASYPNYSTDPKQAAEGLAATDVPGRVGQGIENLRALAEATLAEQEAVLAEMRADFEDGGMDCGLPTSCLFGGFEAAREVAAGTRQVYDGVTNVQTCALLYNGNVDCWGATTGEDYRGTYRIRDYTGGDAVAMDVDADLMCLVTEDGNVACSEHDGLADADAPYLGGDAVDVGVGEDSSCILLNNGNVECRGEADYLGGDAVALTVGTWHACVLTTAANVDCWGSTGTHVNDYLGGDAVAVSAGTTHTCAVLSSGDVDCWGFYEKCAHDCWAPADDYHGGDAVGVSTGFGHSCFLLEDGTVDCEGANWMHETEFDTDTYQAADDRRGDAVGVDVGDYHSCLVTGRGTIRCWGESATDYPIGQVNWPGDQDNDGLPTDVEEPAGTDPASPDTPVASLAGASATFCTPQASAWVYPLDMDGDGVPAVYAKRNDRTTVYTIGGVTQRPGPTYCWLAGDPDDDGKWRGPKVEGVPASTVCGPSTASTPFGADKDGDGIPSQYVRGGTKIRYQEGAVTVSPSSSDCWVAGDPDESGNLPALPPVEGPWPATSACVPNERSQPVGADKDGDGVPAQYARRTTTYTLHPDGSITAAPTVGDCWLFGDPDDAP